MTTSETPLLILIFNRPDKVRALITALEEVRPTRLYISADGPRSNVPTDAEKCLEARALFENLPWECEVHTHFSETNLGCKQGPVSGLDWFFTQVEQGIILEDDCIPDPSFFSFCSILLEKYQDHTEIMHISGNNFQDGIVRGDGSYYFSLYTHSWGWATWRRAWEKYAPALEQFADFDAQNTIATLPLSRAAQHFWIKNFRQTIKGTDSWDSLWLYAVWFNKGLSIIPEKNLVSNIGFGEDATHTFIATSIANVATQKIDTIVHPKKSKLNVAADEYTFKKQFYRPLWKRVVDKISDIISKLWI